MSGTVATDVRKSPRYTARVTASILPPQPPQLLTPPQQLHDIYFLVVDTDELY